jgi:hypothetical protein
MSSCRHDPWPLVCVGVFVRCTFVTIQQYGITMIERDTVFSFCLDDSCGWLVSMWMHWCRMNTSLGRGSNMSNLHSLWSSPFNSVHVNRHKSFAIVAARSTLIALDACIHWAILLHTCLVTKLRWCNLNSAVFYSLWRCTLDVPLYTHTRMHTHAHACTRIRTHAWA